MSSCPYKYTKVKFIFDFLYLFTFSLKYLRDMQHTNRYMLRILLLYVYKILIISETIFYPSFCINVFKIFLNNLTINTILDL